MAKTSYDIRYLVERWGKPTHAPTVPAEPGVRRVTDGSAWGYTDALFAASILKDADGNDVNIILMDSDSGLPTRERCQSVLDHIKHYMEAHLPPQDDDGKARSRAEFIRMCREYIKLQGNSSAADGFINRWTDAVAGILSHKEAAYALKSKDSTNIAMTVALIRFIAESDEGGDAE